MKVIHVVRQYLPSVGGMEEVVRSLASSQKKYGIWDPVILTLDRIFRDQGSVLPGWDNIDGVPIRRIPWRGSERYPFAPSVISELKGADLIHVHGIDFFFDYLALFSFLHKVPMIVSTHGGFFHTKFASRLKKIYFNSITRLSAISYKKIICTSESDGEIFSKVVPQEKLVVIENGVDIHKFRESSSFSWRPVVIYFGRWSENKGLFRAIKLFSDLVLRDPSTDWKFIIAGRAFDTSLSDLESIAQSYGVADRLEIVESPNTEELFSLISRASYFICLSQHEGFGIAPIEAMSAGLYPILSNIPPFKKLIDMCGHGCMLEESDQVNEILRVVSAGRNNKSWGEQRNSIICASQAYSWDRASAQYLDVYMDCA